jgi:4-amino-4-deoxy-L-arabinose transferase-like glycosyltransferase
MRTTINRLVQLGEGLADALADPRRANRTAAALIAIYVLVWWGFALASNVGHDIHFDMGEAFAWSLDPAYGYPKHPPFCAWILTVWFAVFPVTEWAYYLLAVVTAGVALWFVWLISAHYLSGEKRLVALLLLAFTPGFNVFALRYNPNGVALPLWAAAAWAFLWSWRARTALAGTVAGIVMAANMLNKYWAIFQIAGFVLAVAADRRRGAYFRSPAPYASVAAGAVLFAPHLVWLVDSDFAPFKYASTHVVQGSAAVWSRIGNYFGGGLLYLIGPFAIVFLLARPRLALWRDMLWPAEGDRRLMALAQWSSFLMPIGVALAMRAELSSLWAVPFWPMLPALMLAPASVAPSRRAAAGVLAVTAVGLCLVLAAAPVAALVFFRDPGNAGHLVSRPLAREVDRLWPAVSAAPLPYVAGPSRIAWGCSFYCRDHPRALPDFAQRLVPWIDFKQVQRRGFVALCPADDVDCLAQGRALAPPGRPPREETVTIGRTAYGQRSAPQTFTILLSPPVAAP